MSFIVENLSEILKLLGGITVLVGAYIGLRVVLGNKKIGLIEQQLGVTKRRLDTTNEQLANAKRFISSLSISRPIISNVVVIGPKFAGKTVLVKTWTQFWRSHQGQAPTKDCDLHIYDFPNSRPGREKSAQFPDIEVSTTNYAQIKIWDFAGELHLFEQALQRINSLERCTIILVLNADSDQSSILRNREYYSTNFLRRMHKAFSSHRSATIEGAYVIFTKADLLPPELRTAEHLKAAFDTNVHHIEQIFSPDTIYHVLSAQTGEGLVDFLRDLASRFVDEDGLPHKNESRRHG